MKVWTRLQRAVLGETGVLREEKMFRGETNVRMKDIRALFDGLREKVASTDPKVQRDPNVEGDSIVCQYSVDPRVWARWSRSLNFAGIFASTTKDQNVGKAQGHTTVKVNYGGKVLDEPGKIRTDHERMPSSMDRYDVIMVADVAGAQVPSSGHVNFTGTKPAKGSKGPGITVTKIAWSPAIGSAEERQARLEALLTGAKASPLARRPQPELPELPKAQGHWASKTAAPDNVRQGGRMGMGRLAAPNKKDDDED